MTAAAQAPAQPQLLASCPPYKWLSQRVTFAAGQLEARGVIACDGMFQLVPMVLWIEPIEGVHVTAFNAAGYRSLLAPVNALLFRLTVVDIANPGASPITSEALGFPALIFLERGEAAAALTVDVLVGGTRTESSLWRYR